MGGGWEGEGHGPITCCSHMTDATLLLALCGVVAAYFSGVMVRWGGPEGVMVGGGPGA